MGTDSFESKRPGGSLSGTASRGLEPRGLDARAFEGRSIDRPADPFAGEGAAPNLVEVSGTIKWFDASKGYGFVIPDNGWPDVLLHVTVLRRDGYQTAYEGARIVVECLQRAKGYQAFRVVSMDESTAIHPAQLPPPRTHATVTPTSGLERAQVKWFNRLRGFGFLTCGEGTPDIFVHMETLRRYGMTELRPGQYVLVRYGPGSKGMMAAEIQPETGAPGMSH
jgi:CspA family cold shock protein